MRVILWWCCALYLLSLYFSQPQSNLMLSASVVIAALYHNCLLPAAKKTKELLRIKYLLYYCTFLPSQTIGFVLAIRSAPCCISAKIWSLHALSCPKLPFRILITQNLELTRKEWMNIRLVLVLLWHYILFMLYTPHSAPDQGYFCSWYCCSD